VRRLSVVLFTLLLLATSLMPAPAAAQERRCFNETGFCITGRFLSYWEQNGGLPVFGYPISDAVFVENNGASQLHQWFERNVFELHPENAAPYDVLLGRLGDETLLLVDYDWQAQPRDAGPQPGCLWFKETQFNVCNQAGAIGFRAYWESHGLEFDGRAGKSYGESLALFGLPLTVPFVAENPSGDTVLMQWFERARFEWHPNNPTSSQVLLGLLGTDYPEDDAEPEPDPEPTPDPNAACANIRPPVDATISDNCVRYGESFAVETFGWDPNQPLGYWVTDQNGTTVGTIQTVNASGDGRFGGTVNTTNWFGYELRPGDYNFVVSDARNVSPAEKYQDSVAPFRVLP
jgi:hypothetical protein